MIDVSNVELVAERRRLAALYDKRAAVCEERDAALAPIEEEIEAKRDALRAAHRVAEGEALSPLVARSDEIGAPFEKRVEDIDAEIESVNLGTPDLIFDEDGEPVRCDLSGLVIFEGDRCIEDDMAGVTILADVLPWPGDAKGEAA